MLSSGPRAGVFFFGLFLQIQAKCVGWVGVIVVVVVLRT